MDRDQRELLLCLAYLYLTAGRERRALALLLIAERAHPDDPELLRVLGHTLVEAGQAERALAVLDRLDWIEGATPGSILLRSRALHRLGRLAEARAVFRTFVTGRTESVPGRIDGARHDDAPPLALSA